MLDIKNKKILNLDWNLPIDVQEKAISEIASMEDLNLNDLLQPGGKQYWENAAKVLYKIGYPRIEEIMDGLLIWLQDINWPGAMIVIKILMNVPREVFIPYLEKTAIKALDSNDETWIDSLSYFLKALNLKENDFKEKKAYEALVAVMDFWG